MSRQMAQMAAFASKNLDNGVLSGREKSYMPRQRLVDEPAGGSDDCFCIGKLRHWNILLAGDIVHATTAAGG